MFAITPINSLKISEPTSDTQKLKTKKYFTPSFKSKESQLIDEFSKTLLENIKNSSKTDKSLKNIFADKNKTNTFMGVIGGLITSIAAGITELLHNEEEPKTEFIDTFTKENSPNKETEIITDVKNEQPAQTVELKEKQLKEKVKPITPQTLLAKFKSPRGKKTAIEKNLIEVIEKNKKLTLEEKSTLVDLLNKFCGHKRNDYQIINKQKVPNSDIANQLYAELEANEYENCSEIFEKYLTNNIEIKKNSSKETTAKKVKAKTEELDPEISAILANRKEFATTYKDFLNSLDGEEKENTKNLLNELFKKANAETPIASKKFFAQLNKHFKNNFKDLANTCKILDQESIPYLISTIANGSITGEQLALWNKEFAESNIKFNQFVNLQNNGVTSESQLAQIDKILGVGQIEQIEVNEHSKIPSIYLKFKRHTPLKDNLKTIVQAFDIVNNEKNNLEPKQPIKATKESIIQELKNDYQIKGSPNAYANLIAHIYGYKHCISNIDDYDKHIINDRIKDILQVLNNPKIFNPEIFDLHSSLRFLERLVFNQNYDFRKIEDTIRREMAFFMKDLRTAMANGINITPYQHNGKFAPQFTIENEIEQSITITLDKGNKIHTIF